MKIHIAAKCKPFSHTPGITCLIPGTFIECEAFPTLLKIGGREIELPFTGPVAGFTLELDLERNCLFVFGQAKEGYYRLKIEASDEEISVKPEKGAMKKGVTIPFDGPYHIPTRVEKLSLGSHKAQDWDKVRTDVDLKTALPLLFCLGQKLPPLPKQALTGTATLLELPEERQSLFGALQAFFQASFKHMLIPRLVDDQYQGFVPNEPAKGNRFFLLTQGAKLIRSLFFEQNERRLKILPRLPVPFDAGRMTHVQADGIGEIDFEWSKKLLRRLHIRANISGEVIFDLQKEIKTFRVNNKKRQKANEPVLLQAGKTISIDRFEK